MALTFRNDCIYSILNRLTKRPLFTNFENGIHNDLVLLQSHWHRCLTLMQHSASPPIFRQSQSRMLAVHSDHITPATSIEYSQILSALYVGSHTAWRADSTQVDDWVPVKSLLLLNPLHHSHTDRQQYCASNETFSSAWWYRGLFFNRSEHVSQLHEQNERQMSSWCNTLPLANVLIYAPALPSSAEQSPLPWEWAGQATKKEHGDKQDTIISFASVDQYSILDPKDQRSSRAEISWPRWPSVAS